MPNGKEREEILEALLSGVRFEVWEDLYGQGCASRSDGKRTVRDDLDKLKREGLVTFAGPVSRLQDHRAVTLTPEGISRVGHYHQHPH